MRQAPRLRRTLAVVGAVALTTAVAVPTTQISEKHDKFGITYLNPSARGGMSWISAWSGGEYAWSDDPWVELGSPNIKYRTDQSGVLTVSGETSRLYVRDPAKERQWRDVEVTVYARRQMDAGVPYSGIVTAVRTNHGMSAPLDEAPCDSRGITARLRFDGTADFGKETSHPTTISTDPIPVFGTSGMPRGIWIGYKHVVRDIDAPSGRGTRQELWLDLTGGEGGGAWTLVGVHTDAPGDRFGDVACADGVDPTLPMVQGVRVGSESNKPNLSVLFRADELGEPGLQYKWASVREIL